MGSKKIEKLEKKIIYEKEKKGFSPPPPPKPPKRLREKPKDKK